MITCYIQEHDSRAYLRYKLGIKEFLFGEPLKQIYDTYKENNYDFVEYPNSNIFSKFIADVKRRPIHLIPKFIVRTRAPIDGSVKEVFYAFVHFQGTDNKQLKRDYPTIIGIWSKPIFNKEFDLQSEELKATSILDYEKQFEFLLEDEEDKHVLASLISNASDRIELYVKQDMESRPLSIIDTEGFVNATFGELIQMGNSKKMLSEVRISHQPKQQSQQQNMDNTTTVNNSNNSNVKDRPQRGYDHELKMK